MAYKPNFVINRLTNKFCFSVSDHKEDGHKWYELKIDGVPIIQTHFSHNNEDIGPKLEDKIRNQLRVRKTFFYGMMDCNKSQDEYYLILRTDPYPPFPDYMMNRNRN